MTDDLKPFPLHDGTSVDLTIRLVALVALGVTIWHVGRGQPDRSRMRALQIGLFVPLSVLVVPAAWSHYFTILLVPLSVVALGQLRRRPRDLVGWVWWRSCTCC